MRNIALTRDNFSTVVDSTLVECMEEMEKAKSENCSRAILDLQLAINALQVIQKEIKSGISRPQGKRSAEFTRYVIDEEEGMVMNPELREFIVKIEGFYRRFF